MQTVISARPSFARLPSRNQAPSWWAGSNTLMYMLSLKFGSGPSSCWYSSAGSRPIPMARERRHRREGGSSPERELLPGDGDLGRVAPARPSPAGAPQHRAPLERERARCPLGVPQGDAAVALDADDDRVVPAPAARLA